MKHIGICDGTLTIGQYVHAWRTVLAADPGTEFKRGLTPWWPVTREDILREFRRGVHDRIRIRAGLPEPREVSDREIQQLAQMADVPCECRWCGSAIPFRIQTHQRFCSDDCRRQHQS